MARKSIPDLFSSILQSIRDACQFHLQFRDFVSVSGFICIDIDGCSQERLVLAELIGNKDDNETSFPLKALNWEHVRRQSIRSSTFQRSTKNESHPENISNLRVAKETLSKDGNVVYKRDQHLSKEKTPKPVGSKFCSQRNDLRNLTFTMETKHEVETRLEISPPANILSTAAFSRKEGNNDTQKKTDTLHSVNPKSQLRRSFSNCIEQRKRVKDLRISQTVFDSQKRVVLLDRAPNQEQRVGVQISEHKNVSEKDCSTSAVKRDLMVNCKSKEEFNSQKGKGADTTNCNSRPPGGKKDEPLSTGGSECPDGITRGQTRKSNSPALDKSKCEDVRKAGNTMAGNKESVFFQSTLTVDSSQNSLMAVALTKNPHGDNSSLSVKKKKRLMRWLGIFKRDRKLVSTGKTRSLTNTSVTDLSPSWAESILSVQH